MSLEKTDFKEIAMSPPVEREDGESPSSHPKINHISGWHRLVLWPLSVFIRLWSATIRLAITPKEREMFSNTHQPMVIIFWHNRLFLAAHAYRKLCSGRRIYGLVSASKDGAWLAAFLSLMGLGTVRGSSSRGALSATRGLLQCLQRGNDIGITPDGPRGPCYDFKKGAVRLARQAKSPILLASASFPKAWRLKSWDRFYLPKPFSVVEVRVRYYHSFSALGVDSEEEAAQLLRRELEDLARDSEDGS